MFLYTSPSFRQAVAFFNMKQFHSRQKIPLSPGNIVDVFKKHLEPSDRLLRQSRVGGGATRVLVLDKLQQVKGVYHPVHCLPHPSVIGPETEVLGRPISEYLSVIQQPVEEIPHVLTIISHPYGIGVSTFDAAGNAHMPLVNIRVPSQDLNVGIVGNDGQQQPMMKPFTQSSAIISDLMQVLVNHYDEYIAKCGTYFYFTRDAANSALSLGTLRSAEDSDSPVVKNDRGISFKDPRWVPLFDVVLQRTQGINLYVRERKSNDAIVSKKGLSLAIIQGVLELDR